MAKDKCSKCGKAIVCLSDNVQQCMCNKVSLHEETKAFLGKTNYDCLCNDCLLEVDNLVSRVAVDQSDEIAEGKDYYMDNGLVVYTEMYHIKRGYCCNSGCRHCAYGFKRIE